MPLHRPTSLQVKCQTARQQGLNRLIAQRILLDKIEGKRENRPGKWRQRYPEWRKSVGRSARGATGPKRGCSLTNPIARTRKPPGARLGIFSQFSPPSSSISGSWGSFNSQSIFRCAGEVSGRPPVKPGGEEYGLTASLPVSSCWPHRLQTIAPPPIIPPARSARYREDASPPSKCSHRVTIRIGSGTQYASRRGLDKRPSCD